MGNSRRTQWIELIAGEFYRLDIEISEEQAQKIALAIGFPGFRRTLSHVHIQVVGATGASRSNRGKDFWPE